MADLAGSKQLARELLYESIHQIPNKDLSMRTNYLASIALALGLIAAGSAFALNRAASTGAASDATVAVRNTTAKPDCCLSGETCCQIQKSCCFSGVKIPKAESAARKTQANRSDCCTSGAACCPTGPCCEDSTPTGNDPMIASSQNSARSR
jgi:hypothetical protein